MPSNVYLPKLGDLISFEQFPEPIRNIDGFVDKLLNDLYYDDFQFSKSRLGDAAFYRLTVISLKQIGFEIPGTGGLAFLLNPSLSEGGGQFH